MRRLFLFLAILLGAKLLLADVFPGPGDISKGFPRPDTVVTETSFYSSFTCNASNLSTVFISSPFPVYLYSIKVSSPGTGGSRVEVFDGLASTAASRRIDIFQSNVVFQHFYNVATSSWLGVSNQSGDANAGLPACLSILYRTR